MKEILEQMDQEYESIEKQLEKVSKAIFTIRDNENLIEHELMSLSLEIENLGISLNELKENI